ncbi:nSTAND1 domain-containing NTPase [Rhizobium ruizarguesonis]|uniref:nSTAND1 domain-containing NTPase n=1 Tax=Rhizobium ruizarguesonis TaxID=2081791 RepID=UPI001031074D|nr:trypsin-like peptidase domain-containing protein [Rhizobium ruizarguesonis]TBC68709.1 hypothetical protein ELH30_31470 [Rhizobium ruizarguesonis]
MTLHYTQPVACIRDASGSIQGTGWLALGRYVVTCAHVVNDALNRPRSAAEQPMEMIRVDLPFLGKANLLARVVAWYPTRPLADLVRDTLADIAVLDLQGDIGLGPGIEPSRIDRRIPERGTAFLTYGFPTGFDNGIEASGEVLVQDPGGWLQVRDTQSFGYFIQPGFSGAPVFSQTDLRLIGMATASDRDNKTRLAFLLPAHLICRAFPPLALPYRGLSAFDEEDVDLFFGRNGFVAHLKTKLEQYPFTAIVGPSGSGKSSVALAGLASRLRTEGWNIAVCRPLRDPLLQLGLGLATFANPHPDDFNERLDRAERWAARLRQDPGRIVDLAQQAGEMVARRQTRTLVVIDQFEELFTQDAEATDGAVARKAETTPENGSPRQAQFLAVLDAVAAQDPNNVWIRAVATMRADFMSHALAIRRLATLLQDRDVKLGPMTTSELNEAVRMPARIFGVEFEDGLAEEVVTAMQGRTGGLPLLEFTLDRLWRRQEGRKLTWAAYRGPGGQGGLETALDEHAEEVMLRLGSPAEAVVRRVMLRLVRLGEDGEPDARAVVRRSEVDEDDWSVVQKLADRRSRLLTISSDAATGDDTAEIVHEALISAWGRLRGWLMEDRAFGLWRQRLDESLETWAANMEEDDLLLRGRLLTEATDWLTNRKEDLIDREIDFVEASRAHVDREAEEQLRQAQERERLANQLAEAALEREKLATQLANAAHESERRVQELAEERRLALIQAKSAAKRQKGAIRALIAVVTVVVSILAIALELLNESQMRGAMVSAARSRINDGWPLEAAPFAVAAASLSRQEARPETESETDGLIKDTGVVFPLRKYFPDGAADKQHRLSPDGSRLLLQAGNLEASLWNVQTGKEMRAFGRIDRWLAYFENERAVTVNSSNEISIWNLADGELVAALGKRNRSKTLYDKGADDVFLNVSDEQCALWDVRSGAEIKVLGDANTCDAVTLSEKFVVTRSKQKTGIIWDHTGSKSFLFPKGCEYCGFGANETYAYSLNSGDLITYRVPSFAEVAEVAGAKVDSAQYSSDGGRLATIDTDGEVSLWKIEDTSIAMLSSKFAQATTAEFSPDSTILVTRNKDFSGQITRSFDGTQIAAFPPGQMTKYKFLPKSHMLAIMLENRIVALWDTLKAKEIIRLPENGRILDMAASPDDTRLVISSSDRGGYIWNLEKQSKLVDFERVGADSGPQGGFSADSRRYISHAWDLGSNIWDAESGSLIGRLGGPSTIYELETSKDGTRTFTEDPNSNGSLWDTSNITDSSGVADLKDHVCNVNRNVMQFSASQRIDVNSLVGRPWNACDWVGLDRTQGWLQAFRRLGVQLGIAEDYTCGGTDGPNREDSTAKTACPAAK